ncbi:MAG: non-heme iron oxygenase ferredoxin subunit [Chloroflexi bacterium]|nr:MAG: non-heme iron oxygenase ferredoxin subunit [Chloroflexota bacterium]
MTEWVTVCKTAELPDGQREVFGIGDRWIAVFNVNGKYYAIEDLCPHDDGPVAEGELDGYEIECPRHGARFDIRNGSVKAPPALQDVPWYQVRVVDDEVQIALK